MKVILVGCIAAGFAIKKIIDDELSEKLDVTMPDGKMVLIVDVQDPALVNEDYLRVSESEHFVSCGALGHGLLFYGPFANIVAAEAFAGEIDDTYWQLNSDPDPDVDRMIQQAKQGFNLQQKHVIETYEDGDFKHIKTPKDLRHCGDGLLQFAISEISNQEGCDSVHDAALRMESAVEQLDGVVQSLSDIL